jgi:DNA modification methylase
MPPPLWTTRDEPLDALRENPSNPRRIQHDDYDRLKRNLERAPDMLRARPVIARADGEIIGGHMRWRAARDLGWTSIPTIRVDIDDAAAREWNIRDNAGFGEWVDEQLAELVAGLHADGIDPTLAGLDARYVNELLESVGALGDTPFGSDDVPDVPLEPVTRLGDVIDLGPHRLVCGDAFDPAVHFLLLGDARPDAIVTDPPYGINLDTDYSGIHPDRRPSTTVYEAVIGDDAPFDASPIASAFADIDEQFWFGADYYRSSLGGDERDGAWLVWDKRDNDAGMDLDAFAGSAFELVWSRQPHQRRMLRHLWSGHHGMQREDLRSRVHPTQKPTALLAEILDAWVKKDGLVLDLFAGSGSTLIACANTGRRAALVEIDPGYCDVIRARYEQHAAR